MGLSFWSREKKSSPALKFLKMILKGTVNKLWRDRFWGNSLIFLVSSFLAGFGNYLFQILIARFLPRPDYGELQALLAVLGILGAPFAALSIVLVRQTSRYEAEKKLAKIKGLLFSFSKLGLIFGGLFFFVFIFFSSFISHFLKISSIAGIVILGLAFFPFFLNSISRGILQGLEKFRFLSFLGVGETGLKILSAIFLLTIGFRVKGVLLGMILAGTAGYFLTFFSLKNIFREKEEVVEKAEWQEMAKYFFPVFLTILLLGLLFGLDMILVKHFFNLEAAGDYGVLATIARIVFFVVSPFTSVMFPLIAGAKIFSEAQDFFKKTIFATIILSLPVLFFYFLFPELVIRMLIGGKFLTISPFLGWLGLAAFFYGLIQVFSQYFLSLGKKGFLLILISGVLLETIMIFWRHESLWQVVETINLTMAATLAGLLVLYFRGARRATHT